MGRGKRGGERGESLRVKESNVSGKNLYYQDWRKVKRRVSRNLESLKLISL